MKKLKKMIAVIAAAAMMVSPLTTVDAASTSSTGTTTTGVAYEDGQGTSDLAPGIALAVIAAITAIALIINNSSRGSAHSHNHCTNCSS